MARKLLGLLKVYEEEVSLLLWTMVLLFIIRSSGIILDNYAETAFLKRYGVEFLPVVNMLNAVATFLITGMLTVFMNRIPGARLLFHVFILCGISVTVIRLLIPMGLDLLYPLLFMLKSQFELFQAMLFWNMCNDLFNTRQSKRLFPLLTAGGVVGLILGSVGTPYFASLFHLDNLLYLYLGTCVSGAAAVRAMGIAYGSLIFPETKPVSLKNGEKSKSPGFKDELMSLIPLIRESLLVKIVLVLTFMPNVVIPIMNYQFSYAVNDQFASETAMIQFFGYFRGGLYTISLFILLFVGRIYGRWGLPVALMFHPFNYMLAFLAFLLRFDLFSAIYARMSTNILRTTINMPANAILIGLFPEAYRNIIRPFLRGTVVRAALLTGSTLILVSSPFFHPRYLTLVALPFVMAWVAAPFLLKARYSKILLDLVANNLLDIKSFDRKELSQVFNQEKTLADLSESFLSARGPDAVWYAELLSNFSPEKLDALILGNLAHQDEATRIALIKMMSPGAAGQAASDLVRFLDRDRPEQTIAILKRICREGARAVPDVDLSPFVQSDHPVVRGFAGACLYVRDPDRFRPLIEDWLVHPVPGMRQSGIISAGLSGNRDYIPRLLDMLNQADTDPHMLPDIIMALSRLDAPNLNPVIVPLLIHDRSEIRMAALDALVIRDEASLHQAVLRLGDHLDGIQESAAEKIRRAEFQDNRLLIECLGLPSTRIRSALFDLLETLDIKEFDVLVFAKKHLVRSYAYLSMADALANLPETPMRDLAVTHLTEKKEVILENVIRVLALHDKTQEMKTAWRGIFSADTRQRANAVELLNDRLDRRTFNIMLPLLESPTPFMALAEGRKIMKIPRFGADGKTVLSILLRSEDWVDVIMGLGIVRTRPGLFEPKTVMDILADHIHPYVAKEATMSVQSGKADQNPFHGGDVSLTTGRGPAPEIPLGEKILLLRKIDIFSGLSASELAAIAAVTTEMDCAENVSVIRQNDSGDTVFLLVEGRVAVIMEQENRTDQIIDHMEAGSAFGEMALIDDSPRSATIQTVTSCRFLTLHKQAFKETVMEFPGIALQICSVLSRRIRHLHARVQETACEALKEDSTSSVDSAPLDQSRSS